MGHADWIDRIRRLPPAQRAAVADVLGTSDAGKATGSRIIREVRSRGLMQADVVLLLLRAGGPQHRRAVEAIVGSRIKRLLPDVPPAKPRPVQSRGRTGDDRLITYVRKPCPYRRAGDAADRYRHFRVGRTIAQYLAAGGTRRLLREAVSRGWVRTGEDE